MVGEFLFGWFQGYWGLIIVSMEWCEKNYEVIFMVVEFYNIIFNVFGIIFVIIGLYYVIS